MLAYWVATWKTRRITVAKAALGRACRRVWDACFDQYRPELHYMRGPGPRWHEKHR